MISLSLPRSRKTCGWSNGGLAPTHMNSREPISMTGTPASLWKCGTTWSDILSHPEVAMAIDAINTDAASLKRRGPYWRVQMIASPAEPERLATAPCSFAHANSTQSCRLREALLSSGTLCRNFGILCLWTNEFPRAANDQASAQAFTPQVFLHEV